MKPTRENKATSLVSTETWLKPAFNLLLHEDIAEDNPEALTESLDGLQMTNEEIARELELRGINPQDTRAHYEELIRNAKRARISEGEPIP